MKKIFWDDPYQTQLITQVTAVEGHQVLFADTIAYSLCGGQESDRASVNGMAIVDSKMLGHLIYYSLPDHHGLTVGQPVEMTIDWPRRYRLMRLHFAAELILEIITQHLQIEKIGAHIAEHKARIDFRCDDTISHYFEKILSRYNQIIADDLVIHTGFSDEALQIRYWEINGFAKVPCGGTHVRSTKEVGLVNLKRVNVGRGKERVEIVLRSE